MKKKKNLSTKIKARRGGNSGLIQPSPWRGGKSPLAVKGTTDYLKNVDWENENTFDRIPIELEIKACAEDWAKLKEAISDDPETVIDNLRLYVGAAIKRIEKGNNPRGRSPIVTALIKQMKREAGYLYALLQYYERTLDKPKYIIELQKKTGIKDFNPLNIVFRAMQLRYEKKLPEAFKTGTKPLYESNLYKVYLSERPQYLFGNKPKGIEARVDQIPSLKKLFESFGIVI